MRFTVVMLPDGRFGIRNSETGALTMDRFSSREAAQMEIDMRQPAPERFDPPPEEKYVWRI